MQKVVGSSPIIRSMKAPLRRGFLLIPRRPFLNPTRSGTVGERVSGVRTSSSEPRFLSPGPPLIWVVIHPQQASSPCT
jgi:hypothetical protein